MSNDKDLFGGFDALAADLMSIEASKRIDPDIEDDDVDPILFKDIPSLEDEEDKASLDKLENKKDLEDTEDDSESDLEDEISEKDIEKDIEKEEEEKEKSDEPIGLGEDDEKEVVEYFQEKLFDKFGWNIDADDKFEKVEDFVEYLSKVVEENSTPEFASPEIAALNTYVKEGGDLKTYYDQVNLRLDPEEIDLKNEANQILAIRESLKVQGYDSAKINKRIERYSDTGILKDEAEEAVDFLKGYKKQTDEKLFSEQTKFREEQQKQQQKFYSDVKTDIEGLNDILGIPITKADKNKLLEDIFKIESDGETKYQKKYKSSIRNLVESAYFTMMREQLPKKISGKAVSDATVNLKKKLEMKTKRGKDIGKDDDEGKTIKNDHSIFNSFASQLSKPKF